LYRHTLKVGLSLLFLPRLCPISATDHKKIAIWHIAIKKIWPQNRTIRSFWLSQSAIRVIFFQLVNVNLRFAVGMFDAASRSFGGYFTLLLVAATCSRS